MLASASGQFTLSFLSKYSGKSAELNKNLLTDTNSCSINFVKIQTICQTFSSISLFPSIFLVTALPRIGGLGGENHKFGFSEHLRVHREGGKVS